MNEYVQSLITGTALVLLGGVLLILATGESRALRFVRLLGAVTCVLGVIVACTGPILFSK